MSLFRYPSILMTSGYKENPDNWDKHNNLDRKIFQSPLLSPFKCKGEKSSKNSMYLREYDC